MNSCRLIATAWLLVLLLVSCAGPQYGPTPPNAQPILMREPQERVLNGGRVVFPKGKYKPVAAAYDGVLYLPEGYVYAPLVGRHFRAGVLIPVPGAKDTRQGVWEFDERSGGLSLSGKIAVLRFEPPLIFEAVAVD